MPQSIEFDLRKNVFLIRASICKANDLAWINRNTTLVATDFVKAPCPVQVIHGSSSYGNVVSHWIMQKCCLKESKDVGSWPFTLRNIENTYVLVRRSKTFYRESIICRG